METAIPLQKILKGRLLKIAELQDKIIIEASSKFGIILHGGTAMWRIYNGKRFSFDIDLYCDSPREILEYFEKPGIFHLTKGKLTGTDTLYMKFHEGMIEVEMQASTPNKKIQTIDGEFHLVSGDSIIVRTLEPSELLVEKINAFRNRKKSRDLYDIFYLLGIADSKDVRQALKHLIPLLSEPPSDFAGLRELILMGKAPDFDTIVRKVKVYAKN